ncbi:HAD-IC family P-type ATPase [Dongia mobilis]|nr:HAD-IC family P-type ATPase [Dongia mobilis]
MAALGRRLAASPDWHAHPASEAVATLAGSQQGLAEAEAARRLAAFGPNQLPAKPGRHPALRFLLQFHNALIYFLLVAAIGATLLGHLVDAAVIFAVVTVNAIVGFVQEGKAENALNAIRRMVSAHSQVLRDGQRRAIDVAGLVPGDIVMLEAGDRVPADLRLLRSRSLRIDEAMLTGESVAVDKGEAPVATVAMLGDRTCMAYSGTLVVMGQGTGVVVATGAATEIGRIGTLIEQAEDLSTPLLRQINRFGRTFTWVTAGVAAALMAFAVLVRGFDWVDALMAVVALAVGAVPEGLPAVITITLAIGVQRMALRKAVVRRLPAVETLGATSVICSDKTGTLTLNEMLARRVVIPGHDIRAGGTGYVPSGPLEVEAGDDDINSVAAAAAILRCAILCNDAEINRREEEWLVTGDPMEGALVVLGMKAGFDFRHVRHEWPRLDEVPFDAQHRYMATLHRGLAGEKFVFVKGAPERLLAMCGGQIGHGERQVLDHSHWEAQVSRAAAEGERVLGFAMMIAADSVSDLQSLRLDGNLTFLGIVGFIDPPRPEAIAAVAECHSAGIAVKMITGDHAMTAAAIARQLGLADNPEVATGADIDGVADSDLPALAARTSVFARTSPEHKLRIVRALQSNGAVVGMTGDGVNDAPALKQADIGIAMGRKGTEAAKEASNMVLLDDNFASIVAAVREGRTVYDNIRKVIAWTLPTNGGEVIAVIAAILFGFTMPMTAAQILWINLVTSVTLGLVLAFEPAEPGIMRRRPRRPDAPLLSRFLVWRLALVSFLFMGGVLSVFFFALARGEGVEVARTMVVNVIVVMEIFYLFNVRYLHTTSFSLTGILGTRSVLVAVGIVTAGQIAFTYLPFMNWAFATAPLGVADAALVIALGILLLVVLEIEKVVTRRWRLFGEEIN